MVPEYSTDSQRTAAHGLEDLSLQMEDVSLSFFFPLTHGIQLDYFIPMKTMAIRDYHAPIMVVKGWSRYVHSSTAREKSEVHVELFAAEMYASKCIF